MGRTQQIDYVDVWEQNFVPPPVRKQVWNGEKFLSMTLYKHIGLPSDEKMAWLEKTYGRPGIYLAGRFWDYSRSGNYALMDEQVYAWYQLKWGTK